MSVLALLVAQFFSLHHTSKAGASSPKSLNTSTKTRRIRRHRIDRAHRRHARRDRTAWGSYVEHAAPVLPPNTCVPGFENEALLLGKRDRRRQGAEDEWEDDAAHDEEDVTDSDENDEDDVDSEHEHELNVGGDVGLRRRRGAEDGSISHSHGLPMFPSINSLFDLLPTSFSTPSSLFGSTTRPATRTLLDTTEHHQLSVLNVPQQPATSNSLASTRSDYSNRSSGVSGQNTMAPKAHTWITLWFLLTAPVILWDASYCFMRFVHLCT